MSQTLRWTRFAIGALAALCLTTACGGGGGGGGSSSPPPATSPPPPPPADPWANVRAQVQAFGEQNVTVIVGDATGVKFTFERGTINADTYVASASAAKLLTGLTLIAVMESGALTLDSRPSQLLPYWTASDQRATITLRQLLSLTSGFNAQSNDPGCWDTAATTLQACAQTIYQNGLDTPPGDTFAYGPEHLYIAAAMAERADNAAFADIFRTRVADPLGLGSQFRFIFPSAANPRPDGGAIVNASGYATILRAVLNGQLVRNRATYVADFTATARVKPPALVINGVQSEWRYGLGYWLECDVRPFQNPCGIDPTISSAGAFGFTPWIDFEKGYYAVIAIQNTTNGADISTSLEQTLQPLIETALGR